jgi:hypothetical protein
MPVNKGRLALVVFFSLTIVIIAWYFFSGRSAPLAPLVGIPQASGIVDAIISMLVIAAIFLVFKIGSAAAKSSILKSKGATKGENEMVQSVIKFVMLLIGAFVLFSIWVTLGTVESLVLMFSATAFGSAYMLDEFVLRLSFDSDWDGTEKILIDADIEVTAAIILGSAMIT